MLWIERVHLIILTVDLFQKHGVFEDVKETLKLLHLTHTYKDKLQTENDHTISLTSILPTSVERTLNSAL